MTGSLWVTLWRPGGRSRGIESSAAQNAPSRPTVRAFQAIFTRPGPGVDMSHAAKCSDLLEPVSANGAVARSEASQSEMGGISMFALSPLGRRHMHLRGKDMSKMRGVVE